MPDTKRAPADNEIFIYEAGDPSVGIPDSTVRIVGDCPFYDDLVKDELLEEVREELARGVGLALFGNELPPSAVVWGCERRRALEAEDRMLRESTGEEADHA